MNPGLKYTFISIFFSLFCVLSRFQIFFKSKEKRNKIEFLGRGEWDLG